MAVGAVCSCSPTFPVPNLKSSLGTHLRVTDPIFLTVAHNELPHELHLTDDHTPLGNLTHSARASEHTARSSNMSARLGLRFGAAMRQSARPQIRMTQRRLNATVAEPQGGAFVRLWHSNVGPKTVHFWAPIMKVRLAT